MGSSLSRLLKDPSAQGARPCQKETSASPESTYGETFHDAMEYPVFPGSRKRKRDPLWTEDDLKTEVMTSAEKCRLFLDSLEDPKPTRSVLHPMAHQDQITKITNHRTPMSVSMMATPESETHLRGPANGSRHGSKKRVRFRSDSEFISPYHQAAEEHGPHIPTGKGHNFQEHSHENSISLVLTGLHSELIMEEATRQTSEEVESPEQDAVSISYVPTRAEFHAERSAEREKKRKAHQLGTLEGQKKKKTRKVTKSGPMLPRSERQIAADNEKPRYNLVRYAEDYSPIMYSPSTSDPADAMYIQYMDTIPCKKGCWIKTLASRKLGYGRELTQTEVDTLDSKLEDANCDCVVCAELDGEEIERCLQEGRYARTMTGSVDHSGLDGFEHGYDQFKKFRISGYEWNFVFYTIWRQKVGISPVRSTDDIRASGRYVTPYYKLRFNYLEGLQMFLFLQGLKANGRVQVTGAAFDCQAIVEELQEQEPGYQKESLSKSIEMMSHAITNDSTIGEDPRLRDAITV